MDKPGKRTTSTSTRAERKAKRRQLEEAVAEAPGDGNGDGEGEFTQDSPILVSEISNKRRKIDYKSDAGKNRMKGDGRKEAEEEKETSNTAHMSQSNGNKGTNLHLTDKNASPSLDIETGQGILAAPRKSKKERKAEKKARLAAQGTAVLEEASEPAKTTRSSSPQVALEKVQPPQQDDVRQKKRPKKLDPVDKSKTAKGPDKQVRFIVFIGNLPFTATTEAIEKHFATVKPTSVRHLTKKDNPSMSKGYAFLEFAGYDHMKTCLKLFHHSVFDDGKSQPRKISVELTAGGGGNTSSRKAKIAGKNQRLHDQRVRKVKDEKTAKLKANEDDHAAVHPSRRGRIDT